MPSPPPASTKIYVANHSKNGSNASIAVFPANGSGNIAPLQLIAGPNTQLDQIQFPAVDSNGTIYATNQGSSLAGSLVAFDPTAKGNVFPTSAISGFNTPTGVTTDGAGNIYVATVDHIYEYARGATGNAMPIRSIGANPNEASKTGLAGPYGIVIDGTGKIYVAQSEAIYVFAAGASGNVAPVQNISGMGSAFASDLSVAVDSTGRIYCTNFSINTINIYPAGATGAAQPMTVVTSAALNEPFGIALDKNDNIYVANYGNSSVVEFPAGSSGAAVGTVISGTMTGIDHPYGIAVH